jgi:mono/diheme cytochrome c family protein
MILPHVVVAVMAIATALFVPLVSAGAAGDAAQGKATAQRWCNTCHVVEPGGRGSDMAPAFVTIARARDDANLRGFLTRPHPPMPRFELSRPDIDDLVAYFASLRQ